MCSRVAVHHLSRGESPAAILQTISSSNLNIGVMPARQALSRAMPCCSSARASVQRDSPRLDLSSSSNEPTVHLSRSQIFWRVRSVTFSLRCSMRLSVAWLIPSFRANSRWVFVPRFALSLADKFLAKSAIMADKMPRILVIMINKPSSLASFLGPYPYQRGEKPCLNS